MVTKLHMDIPDNVPRLD